MRRDIEPGKGGNWHPDCFGAVVLRWRIADGQPLSGRRPECHRAGGQAVTLEIRSTLERILGTYDDIDRRLTTVGGLPALLELYERVRRELERVSFQEIDQVTAEIKDVIEALLKMSYELRKVHNLKLIFEAKTSASGD
jgi:hypothetical protein